MFALQLAGKQVLPVFISVPLFEQGNLELTAEAVTTAAVILSVLT